MTPAARVAADPAPEARPAPRSRPGGRSARVREAVFRAVTDLCGECGREALTVPAVAARAGVNPTTVYRRWGSIPALLEDVAAHRIVHAEAPDTGSLDGDLAAYAEQLLDELNAPGSMAVLRIEVDADLRARREGLARCSRIVADRVAAILDRAEARGDARPGITAERIVDRVVAPLHYRVLYSIPGTDAAFARGLVAELAAEGPRAAQE